MTASSDPNSVPSPCVSVCKLTANRSYCLGCLRTLDEIRAWRHMDADEKRALLAALTQRRQGGEITPRA